MPLRGESGATINAAAGREQRDESRLKITPVTVDNSTTGFAARTLYWRRAFSKMMNSGNFTLLKGACRGHGWL